jgi:hypothetical protein
MPVAHYKDLCIDAVDPHRLGRFWAAALHLDPQELDDGDVRLTGPTPAHTVWVNKVPEPVTVKQRAHIDIWAGSVGEIEALGATVVDRDSFAWVVMKDPEGGELCVFTDESKRGLYEINVDTGEDHGAVASWWGQLLGGHVRHEKQRIEFSYVEDVPGLPFEYLTFAPVPEPKTVKNRIHIDVTTPDLEAVVAVGATILRPQDADHIEGGIGWAVMADPAGNEFCAFVRSEG